MALRSGQLLSENQQSSTTSAGLAANGTNTTVSWDQAVYKPGANPGSLKMVATAAGNVEAKTGYGITAAVPADTLMYVDTWVKTGDASYSVRAIVNWIGAGTQLSQVNVECVAMPEFDDVTDPTWKYFRSPDLLSPGATATTPATDDAQVIWNVVSVDAAREVWIDERGFIIKPAPANNPPTAAGGADKTAFVGDTVTLTGTASDTDGTIAKTEWVIITKPAGSAALLTGTGDTVSLAGDVAGPYDLEYRATDDKGAVTADPVRVTFDPKPVVAGPTALRRETVNGVVTWVRRKVLRRNAASTAWNWDVYN